MFGAWHDWVFPFLSLFLTGAVIKLLDDYLDADFDLSRGRRTLANRLGRATLPYVMVIGFLGAYFDVHLTIAVFFASYALGMVCTWRDKLPTRVASYVEIIIAIALSCLLTGWHTALWALSMMAVIDWLDDLIDASGDKLTGQNNVAVRIGTVETLLLVLAALCIAVLTNVSLTVLSFVALTCLTLISEFSTTHIWKHSVSTGEDDEP